nr:lema family [uncultured bacterium]
MDWWIIAIGVFVLIGIVIIAKLIKLNNRYIEFEETCENANQSIEVQQMSRYDLLKNLLVRIKEFKSHEIDVLSKVIASRKAYKMSCEGIENGDKGLSAANKSLRALAEQYPDVKSNTLYQQYMGSASEYENKVRLARMVYNDTASKFNIFKRSFPNNVLLALIVKDTRRTALYDVPQGRTEYPDAP